MSRWGKRQHSIRNKKHKRKTESEVRNRKRGEVAYVKIRINRGKVREIGLGSSSRSKEGGNEEGVTE